MWTERHRPSSLSDFVFQDGVTELHIRKFFDTKEIPHLLFSGPPGTGKTSCAMLLIKHLDIDPTDVLLINASKENSADTIREKVANFCSVAPMNSDFKVVFLEEADFLTPAAQSIMRRLMEEQWRTVRFVLTCNYASKLRDAINSRLQHFIFRTLPQEQIVARVVAILDAENVEWHADDVSRLIDHSPNDLRKIIGMLEQYTVDNQLVLPSHLTSDGDYDQQIIDMMAANNWDGIRQLAAESISDAEVAPLFKVLYNNFTVNPALAQDMNKWEQAIVTTAEYMHRAASVADQYLNFAALLIELKRTSNGQ